jgi:hypothetical protein
MQPLRPDTIAALLVLANYIAYLEGG